MIHLRMTGKLLLAPAGTPRPPHSHVVMTLDGEELRFVDPRTFGEIVVFDPDRADVEVPELGRLGPDPVVDGLTSAVLRARLAGRSRPLKSWLSDQQRVAGLGNIYTDEVLHAARLRFDRPAGSLDARQVRPCGGHPGRVGGGDRRGRLDADRQPVRRPVGRAGPLPARAPGVRPYGRSLPPLWEGHDRPRPLRRPFDVLLPPLPAVRASGRAKAPSSRQSASAGGRLLSMNSRSDRALSFGVRTRVS